MRSVIFEQISPSENTGKGPAEYWWRDEHHQWHKGLERAIFFFGREVEDLLTPFFGLQSGRSILSG